MKTGWIVESKESHVGIGRIGWKQMWVPFDDPGLLLFHTEEAALKFMRSFSIENSVVTEHGWYGAPENL